MEATLELQFLVLMKCQHLARKSSLGYQIELTMAQRYYSLIPWHGMTLEALKKAKHISNFARVWTSYFEVVKLKLSSNLD